MLLRNLLPVILFNELIRLRGNSLVHSLVISQPDFSMQTALMTQMQNYCASTTIRASQRNVEVLSWTKAD